MTETALVEAARFDLHQSNPDSSSLLPPRAMLDISLEIQLLIISAWLL
jgi:hypothetical protein